MNPHLGLCRRVKRHWEEKFPRVDGSELAERFNDPRVQNDIKQIMNGICPTDLSLNRLKLVLEILGSTDQEIDELDLYNYNPLRHLLNGEIKAALRVLEQSELEQLINVSHEEDQRRKS